MSALHQRSRCAVAIVTCRALVALVVSQAAALGATPPAGAIDPGFSRPQFRGTVAAIQQVVKDGRGGLLWSFGSGRSPTSAGDRSLGLVRTDDSGSVDPTFQIGPKFNLLRGVAVGADGSIYLAAGTVGDQSAEGVPHTRIHRIRPDGQIDEGYRSPAFDAAGPNMAVQSDGKLIVTTQNAGPPAGGGLRGIFRLNPDGRLDDQFQAPLLNDHQFLAVPVIDSEGRILIAGSFTTVNGQYRPCLARLLSDGSLDPVYIPAGYAAHSSLGTSVIRSIILLPDGSVVVGGRWLLLGNNVPHILLKLDRDGRLDPDFRSVPRQSPDRLTVRDLDRTDDGRIVAAANGVFRLMADGAVDEAFAAPAPSPESYVSGVALLDRGRMLLVGGVALSSLAITNSVVCLNSDGSLCQDFFPPAFQTDVFPSEVAVDAGGGLLVAGPFDRMGTTPTQPVVRLLGNGSLDASFQLVVSNQVPEWYPLAEATALPKVSSIQPLADGRVYALVTTGSGGPYPNVVQLHRHRPDGGPDPTFTRTLFGVRGIRLLGDRLLYWLDKLDQAILDGTAPCGRLLIDGEDDLAFSAYTNRVGRYFLNPDTERIDRLEVGRFTVLGMDSQGRFVASITEGSADDDARSAYRVVRFNTDGSLDPAFASKEVAGGRARRAYPELRNPLQYERYLQAVAQGDQPNIDKYANYTEQVPTIYPGTDPFLSGALLADGSVLVAGSFDQIGEIRIAAVARLDAAGDVDPRFKALVELVSPDLPSARPVVHQVMVDRFNRIWITGYFNRVNGVTRSGVARLHPDGSLDTAFEPGIEYVAFTANTSGIVPDGNSAIYLYGSYRQKEELWPFGVTKLLTDEPSLQVSRASGNGLDISWTDGGELESAPAIDGPWTRVEGTQSPFLTTATDTARFYRLRF